jgi:enterochelin esterase-like enzyme
MLRPRQRAALLAAWLVSYPCGLAAAGSSMGTLELGHPRAGEIAAGGTVEYELALRAGDFVRGALDQDGTGIRLRGFLPDGSKIRAFGGPETGTKAFRFVAEGAGSYRLELTPTSPSGRGRYRLEITEIQSMSERLRIPRDERWRSPRIERLRNEIAAGHHDALARFWSEVVQETTPLYEPIPGDEEHILVTFLWKATFETYNVVVAWAPYFEQRPEDFQMARLPDTDVWYKTMRVRRGARFWYQLSPNDTLSRSANAQRYATAQLDPLNPRRRPDDPNVTRYEVSSLAELPGAPPQPWLEPRAGVTQGSLTDHPFASRVLGNTRTVSVYLPAGYDADAAVEHPLIVLFDRGAALRLGRITTQLDNLIAARALPPAVAVFIGNPDDAARTRELTCNPDHAEHLHTELLPWLRARFRVTRDPRRVLVGGVSHGGLAAVCAAMRHPETFGNVLAQSGTFWFVPGQDLDEIALRTGDRENNWVARQFIERAAAPIRFFLEAGLFENDIYGSGGQILETTRHLRDVLRARGYEVEYRDYVGGHDWIHWRGSLADGLMVLLPPQHGAPSVAAVEPVDEKRLR